MKFRVILFFLFLLTTSVRAAIVSGIVRNEDGEILPFATIYIREVDFGTTTNLEGYYEIELAEGDYTFLIQYLGYSTLTRKVKVGEGDQLLNFRLQTRSMVLPNLTYRAGEEDPAYAIMRLVIARSTYHLYQLESYTTEVYIKGSGRLKKAPFFLRNRLKKEGIDSSRVFMSESVSEIKFELPNSYTERVISVNTSEDDNSPDPMPFIKASFYQPRVADALSPISPDAFNHYKFRYEGFFQDQGVVVNKIYVEPKIRGDIVFKGYLYIIDGLWAIHSLDFDTFYQGFDINIQQIYHPVIPEVWMPVTHKFDVEGSFLGFEFEFKYVAAHTGYQVKINDQLMVDDSTRRLVNKVESTGTGQDQDTTRKANDEPLMDEEPLNGGEPLSKKEIRKMIRESEKKALRGVDQDEDVLYTENSSVEPDAYSRDSTFWKNVRPIPLSPLERKSLVRRDSLAEFNLEKKKEDSVREEKNKKFRPQHLITGNTYSLSDRISLTWRPLWNKLSFNTVEGWNLHAGMDFKYEIDSSRSISFGPIVRYGFSSRQWYGEAYATYDFRQHLRTAQIKISGGKYIYQINRANPIPFWLNSVSSLFFRENFMKLFERNYLEAVFRKPLFSKLVLEIQAGWSRNFSLKNNTDFSFSNQNKEFSPNNPGNILTGETVFDPYTLYSASFNLHYFPFLKFFVRNGEKNIIPDSSPEFTVGYKPAIAPGYQDGLTYHKLQGAVRYGRKSGVDNRLELYVAGSGILTGKNRELPFPEFHHFQGNQTPLITGNVYTTFRMLDYYYYSTDKYHFESHLLYQFRRLLVTQIIYARMAGIREDLMIRYLNANSVGQYLETGYAIDNLFSFFRLELVAQFVDFEYQGIGFMIGFSKNLSVE